ncbi:MAG: hypothetical protein EOL87_14835 [Spartobacteria bacterium]|nr:hypothetical protein [Spartobacteria bacterium]
MTTPIQSMHYFCRPGFEAALTDEWRSRSDDGGAAQQIEPGVILASSQRPADDKPYIFEQFRLYNAHTIPMDRLKPLTDEDIDAIYKRLPERKPWSLHTLLFNSDSEPMLARRLSGIAATIERLGKKHAAMTMRFQRKSYSFQLVLVLTPSGLYAGAQSKRPDWTSYRMKMDSGAPSRSYLKMEEAFVRLGEYPEAGQRVVDLGAAPGGWSFAFLKRGCHVMAVDHGPMKIRRDPLQGGSLEHLRKDGISFKPHDDELPMDWMVSDMLVAPGVALGLIKRWLGGGWTRRMVCNIKIPQQEPFAAIQPVIQWIALHAPEYSVTAAQLFHDRREITIMARQRV